MDVTPERANAPAGRFPRNTGSQPAIRYQRTSRRARGEAPLPPRADHQSVTR